jgi:uncharacterized membrane protein YkoI
MRYKIAVVAAAVFGILIVGALAARAATTPPATSPTANADENKGDQSPSYTGSVKAPAENNASNGTEADDAKALQGLAKITPDQAKAAALAGHAGGTAGTPSLEDENGFVVYSVEVTAGGKTYDVKVDAGNGKVLATEEGGAEDGNKESGEK